MPECIIEVVYDDYTVHRDVRTLAQQLHGYEAPPSPASIRRAREQVNHSTLWHHLNLSVQAQQQQTARDAETVRQRRAHEEATEAQRIARELQESQDAQMAQQMFHEMEQLDHEMVEHAQRQREAEQQQQRQRERVAEQQRRCRVVTTFWCCHNLRDKHSY